MDDGLALLHRAVHLEHDPDEQAELWHWIGRANVLKFDGDAFWRAMEEAIELGGPPADLYAELAFQSLRRWGMWKRQPDSVLIEGWIERALELAEEGSRNRALALSPARSRDAGAGRDTCRTLGGRGRACPRRARCPTALVEGADPDGIEPPSALLDAFVALGEHDRIEAEAPAWLRPATYAEPFALRALGLTRGDSSLIEQAFTSFQRLGLVWEAERTKPLF
jgi:hypothetical protein